MPSEQWYEKRESQGLDKIKSISQKTSSPKPDLSSGLHMGAREKITQRVSLPTLSMNTRRSVTESHLKPQSRTRHPTKLKVRTDKSALILVTIVVLFIITHCYRLALKIYEVASPSAHTMESFEICYSLGR